MSTVSAGVQVISTFFLFLFSKDTFYTLPYTQSSQCIVPFLSCPTYVRLLNHISAATSIIASVLSVC